MGYFRAGFDVDGVDVRKVEGYPFDFVQGDAVQYILEHGREYDAIHMSPPCQARCNLTRGTNWEWFGNSYPDLIDAARAAAETTGRRWVLENVPGSGIRRDLTLCGEQFGLAVLRHRYFELGGWRVRNPLPHREHRGYVRGWRHGVYRDGPYLGVYGAGGGKADAGEAREALGIDWSWDLEELTEAIPPAYTEWIGGLLRTLL
jgi:hypothetical protein